MTEAFHEGDRGRVDIPNRDDPDFDAFHGRVGTVVDVSGDDAGASTGDQRDSVLYRVEFEDGDVMDFRWRDLRAVRSE
jgi:ribosomal protein L21E